MFGRTKCNCTNKDCRSCQCFYDCTNCQCTYDCKGFSRVDTQTGSSNTIYITQDELEGLIEQGQNLQSLANKTGKTIIVIRKGWKK